jgi:hypothetical protein
LEAYFGIKKTPLRGQNRPVERIKVGHQSI